MSIFEWVQLLMIVLLVAGVTFLFLNQVTIRRQLHDLVEKNSEEGHDGLSERVRQCEVDSRRVREELVQALFKVDAKVKDLSDALPKDPWDVKQVSSSEANELRSLAESRDEIPSLRQIERTRQRLQSELHVDLRTLLRDQLA